VAQYRAKKKFVKKKFNIHQRLIYQAGTSLLVAIAFLHLHRRLFAAGAILLIRLVAIEAATQHEAEEQGRGHE
jgi:hypothetical protein